MGHALSCDCAEAIGRTPRVSSGPGRETWLEQRCAELAAQNEALRQKLRELQPQPELEKRRFSATPLNGHPPALSSSMSSAEVDPSPGSIDLAATAIAAAAEATAEYQRSMVKVTIDNDSQPSSTMVVVRAPNRRHLLADMSSALSGLGLLVIEARSTTSGSFAVNHFALQEAVATKGNGRKVLERERLRAVEQRLQQRFCGAQGINGGVRRLMVERFIRAEPPWEHEALEPADPPADEVKVWLALLSKGLRGGSSLGILSPSLASKLAADLLPEMTRMSFSGTITSEQTAGEWLLLLEGRMLCRVSTAPATPVTPASTPPARQNGARAAPRALEVEEAEVWLEGGAVLWNLVHPPSALKPGAIARNARARAPLRWTQLRHGEEGAPAVVRGIHLSTVRSRLVGLKESLAREQAQVLADTPVFAPLSTGDLLELCRRATEVVIPPGSLVHTGNASTLPTDPALSEDITEVIEDSTFGLVLTGELQVHFLHSHYGQPTPNGLPALIPIGRMKPRDTFGETGLPLPDGVSFRSEGGARLLCWQRDPVLTETLHSLVGDSRDATPRPSLLELCWMARTPLSLLVVEPRLLTFLQPMPLGELKERFPDPDGADREAVSSTLMLVLSGNLFRLPHRDTQLDVYPLPEDKNTGDLKLAVRTRLPSRCHSFSELSTRLFEMGLQVSDATFSLQRGVVHDSFQVTLPRDDRPADVQLNEYAKRIQELYSLQISTGDSMLLQATDGLSRIYRLSAVDEDSAVCALLDLRRFGEALACQEGALATLWRKYLECHAPSLVPPATNGNGKSGHTHAPDAKQASKGYLWYDLLCSFNLFRLRDSVGQSKLGVVPSDLEVGLKLGEGGYGVVHLARHRVSGKLFAVKSFTKARIRRIDERSTYMRLERERKTLRLLSNTSKMGSNSILAKLICSGQDHEWLRLVMPACLGGDLNMLLDQVGRMQDTAVQFYAGCVVLALQQLHNLNIAYRDLKPENVLLYSTGWPVLTDFGLVAFLDDGPAKSMVGTTEFMAPEIVAGNGHGTDADYWSLGVLLCELLTLTTPFVERDSLDQTNCHQKTFANIVQGKYSKNWEQKAYRRLGSRAGSVIDGLLQVDTATRLGGNRRGAESIRVHPFFWGLSWEALESRQLNPPYASICGERGKTMRNDFANAKLSPLPQSSRERSTRELSELDPAASALDQLFDFSEW